MNYTGQTSFAEMFEYYCNRNVTNEREYNEREMLRWLKQQLQQARREGWEQGKRECVEKIDSEICDCCWGGEAQEASDHLCETIAAMEYGGKAND